MTGPKKKGHWTEDVPVHNYDHLVIGRQYRVVREFRDFDSDLHPAGESWIFLGMNPQPYDDAVCLFVSMIDAEWMIPLQNRPESQADVLDGLLNFIQPAKYPVSHR